MRFSGLTGNFSFVYSQLTMSTMNIDGLRKALRLYRLANRISYVQLAHDLKLTEPAVMNFIKGRTNPHETTVYAVEQYLKSNGVEVAA
jgi:hypothetical protein